MSSVSIYIAQDLLSRSLFSRLIVRNGSRDLEIAPTSGEWHALSGLDTALNVSHGGVLSRSLFTRLINHYSCPLISYRDLHPSRRRGGESRPGDSVDKRLVGSAHPTTAKSRPGGGALSQSLFNPLISYKEAGVERNGQSKHRKAGARCAPYDCEIVTGRSFLLGAGTVTG